MNDKDFTMCHGCNRNSRGEEYCAVCERKITQREQKINELGYEPPLTVSAQQDRYQLLDKNKKVFLTVWSNKPAMADIVQGLAEYLSERGEDFITDE